MITEPQARVLAAILNDGGDVPGTSSVKNRLKTRGFWEWSTKYRCGRKLTPAGASALHEWHLTRWAKTGCMAHQDDYKEIETLLKSKGFMG